MITEKILVVDDEVTVCDSIKKILNRQGYKVDNTLDADEALKMIKNTAYDLVITDLMMPKTNGLELLQLIKDYYPELQVVVITGYASIETAVKATKLGASDYIPKPFTPDELKNITRKVLENRTKIHKMHEIQTEMETRSGDNLIDVDLPFDKSEVERATSKEFIERLTHSDIPHASTIGKKTEYCNTGQRQCRRVVLEKRECVGECPLVKKERKNGMKKTSSVKFGISDIIDADMPFSISEIEKYTASDYIDCMDRSDIPRAALYGRNIISKHKILVVDDEPIVCNSVRKILRKKNCSIEEAFDTDAALRRMKVNKYDLVFLDLRMPNSNNLEVLKSIRKKYPDTPVIIITGYASIETAIEATRLGAYNFISKPFTPEELNKAATEALAA
jgi:DNA-binding response OmpR family regulator